MKYANMLKKMKKHEKMLSEIPEFFSKQQKLERYKRQKLFKAQWPLTKLWAALGPPNHMYLIKLFETFLE